MQPQEIEAKVDRLERRVDMLEQSAERLDRLEGHILQFKQETRGEFSAVRAEMRQQGEELRGEVRQGGADVRADLRQELRSQIQALAAHTHNELVALGVMLTDKMEKGLAENAAQSRTLHEDLVGKIAALAER